jgi:hypothetical protein
VGVGHDVAVGVEDEPGAHAALLRLAVRRLLRVARIGSVRLPGDAEEATEQLRHLVVLLVARAASRRPAALGGADVDDSGPDLFDQIGEVGEPWAATGVGATVANRLSDSASAAYAMRLAGKRGESRKSGMA